MQSCLAVVARVCETVGYAHARGVIHRDLKPSNVLIGSFSAVHVIDWGSARILPAARAAFEDGFARLGDSLVQTDRQSAISRALNSPLATYNAGQPITFLFSPPEILRGELSSIGPRTDIYSLGVVLYELLASRPPYSNREGVLPSPERLREQILREPPESLSSARPGTALDLVAICEKAMSRDPQQRYASAPELAADLRAFLEIRPVTAPGRQTVAIRLHRWARRNSSYVAFGSLAFVLVASSALVALRFKTRQDYARQMTALREADLAGRSGRWRQVIQHLAEAEAAGYADSISLALQRTEAWTVLTESHLAREQLEQIVRRKDLGRNRGLVLLKLGEHELFDRTTSQHGITHTREALAAGLPPADEAFAKGLLADSTSGALDHLHEALRLNPYHHGAHRHSMGLEFLLGRQSELEPHLRVFKVLFPEDPSPTFIEATQLALAGKLTEAQALVAGQRDASGTKATQFALGSFQLLANARDYFDVDTLLGERKSAVPEIDEFIASASSMLLTGSASNTTNTMADVRFPQIPCIKNGLEQGMQALQSLLLSQFAGADDVVTKIKLAWQHHPEGLLPLTTAMFLDMQRPTDQAGLSPFLTRQADLLQMAAGSPSVLPKVPRLARYMLALTQFERSRLQPELKELRVAALSSLRSAAAAPDSSPAECKSCFGMALKLRDLDLAREILFHWDRHPPASRDLLESRVHLDLVSGSFGDALTRLDRMLAENPADEWAIARRADALRNLQKMAQALRPARGNAP